MSSTTTTAAAASNVAGIWFGELSAVLQGKWEVMMSHGQRQRQTGATVQGKEAVMTEAAAKGVAAGKRRKEDQETGGCGGAMSDTTVCLLLDRFAPS